jgi:hypothetical protein
MVHITNTLKYTFALVLLIGTIIIQTTSVSASIYLPHYVSSAPDSSTPHALGTDQSNTVADIVQAGNKMFYGGYFAQAASPDRAQTISCGHLIMQDLRTGKSSCPIRFNDRVEALIASADGRFLYVGGQFTAVIANGKTYPRVGVTRIDTATMTVTPFDIHLPSGQVNDLKIIGRSLVVAGSFTRVQGVARRALATVSASTGKLNNLINFTITGTLAENAGATKVYRIAINPQNNRAIIMGNFTRVGGVIHLRAAMIRIGSTSSNLSSWYAPTLSQPCASKIPAYIRDIDFSPDGSEFAMATTGGRFRYPKVCDAVSLWPTNDSSRASPKWVDYTPNDTLHSVVHTGLVVYAAGHEKAHNTKLYLNGRQVSTEIAPEVKVSGITALYATSGKVAPKNVFWAGRDRGEGARKLYVVPADAYHPAGIYVGSDTEWWYNKAGDRTYRRERIAFLPMQ